MNKGSHYKQTVHIISIIPSIYKQITLLATFFLNFNKSQPVK